VHDAGEVGGGARSSAWSRRRGGQPLSSLAPDERARVPGGASPPPGGAVRRSGAPGRTWRTRPRP
jgi:hypothetical protein